MEEKSKYKKKNKNENISFFKKIFISSMPFLLITILVTQALEDRIFFSVFVGIPAGIVGFLITFIYLGYKTNGIKK